MMVTLVRIGFDPYLGFYHQPRYGRPALALDLIEEFRPLIADSVAIGVINNGEVRPSDFITRAGSVALKAEGRKRLLEAYERRLDTEVTHPRFGYSVSYRRVFEIQARLLARFLSGEIPGYEPFCTR
jgi:CRISPR-associated protein Cas1